MTSIKALRQIVSEIHSIVPQGARKAVRSELTELINRPTHIKDNEWYKGRLTSPTLIRFQPTFPQAKATVKFRKKYSKELISEYLQKTYDKEQNMLINKMVKKLGIQFNNQTKSEVSPEEIFNILQGLVASRQAGFKLPQNIVFKNLGKLAGAFKPSTPKIIYLDPAQYGLCSTTIHEIAHLNDKVANNLLKTPIIGLFSVVAELIMPHLNKKLIQSEIGKDACKNRSEFVAHTAEELIYRNKTWFDFDSKIEKLYKLVKGPKLNLGETKAIN